MTYDLLTLLPQNWKNWPNEKFVNVGLPLLLMRSPPLVRIVGQWVYFTTCTRKKIFSPKVSKCCWAGNYWDKIAKLSTELSYGFTVVHLSKINSYNSHISSHRQCEFQEGVVTVMSPTPRKVAPAGRVRQESVLWIKSSRSISAKGPASVHRPVNSTRCYMQYSTHLLSVFICAVKIV